MGRKYKKKLVKVFSIFVSLLMVFALVPVTANAADNTIYNADGISITIEKIGATGSRTVDFKVVVDGEEKEQITLDNVPLTGGYLKVAAENYDVYYETKNMRVDPSNGRMTFGLINDDYNCTIHLTTSKTNDKIDIQDEDTVYGTFSWSKQHADTSAYPRDIEIYVNGEHVYTQKVYTPKSLTNVIGANDQFWFTPNEKFNPTYKMDKDYIDDSTQKTLRIDLTTKCGCGLDTCLCEGGCKCPEDCTCDACQGKNLTDNQINTGYGILEYKNPGISGGYNLTVKINLNGKIVYTSPKLRVSGNTVNNLTFEPTAGKYYLQKNDHCDIDAYTYGATWSKGMLNFAGALDNDREYDNVLTINLVSFSNRVSLDVERRPDGIVQGPSVTDNMVAYRVSYTLDGVNYTYDYDELDVFERPDIPTNVPVTITAICKSPYEVARWSCANVYAGNMTLTGSEGEDGTKAYGNSVTLTVNSVQDTDIALYVEELKEVKVPTDDDLIDPETGLLKDNAVTIDCVNEQENHENKTYGLKKGTYKIGDLAGNSADGYTCDIIITNPNSYVNDYNNDLPGHVLNPEEQSHKITLRHVNGKWTVDEGEAPVKYTVKCETDPGTTIPEKPDNPTVEELLINNAVTIDCINNEVNHPNKTYGLLGKYTIGEVTGDETKGYKVDITVEPDEAYVIKYNEDTGVQHSLLPEQQEAKVITLVYDDGQWALEEGYTPVTYTVICDSDSGDQTDPSDPTNPDDDNPVNPGGDDGNQGGNDNTDDGNGNNTGNTNDNGNNSGNTNNNGSGNNAGQNGNQNVNNGNTTNGNGAGTNGTTSSTNSSQNPKTSDDSAIVTWMSLVVLAAGGIAVITKKTLKKNK